MTSPQHPSQVVGSVVETATITEAANPTTTTATFLLLSILLKIPLVFLTRILESKCSTTNLEAWIREWFLAFHFRTTCGADTPIISGDPCHLWKPTLETIHELENEDEIDDESRLVLSDEINPQEQQPYNHNMTDTSSTNVIDER